MMPKHLQLRRTQGWRSPPGAIAVSPPSRNSFIVGEDGSPEEVVALYRAKVLAEGWDLSPLRARDLLCWCQIRPCHTGRAAGAGERATRTLGAA